MTGNNLGQIIADVVSAYDVDEDVARSDVLDFVSDLVNRGLLSQSTL